VTGLNATGTEKIPSRGVSPPALAVLTWRLGIGGTRVPQSVKTASEMTHMTNPSHDQPPARRVMPPATPRWVRVFGAVVILVLLLFVALRFTIFRNH
jgi:hypothetical protein